jgi:hypothetical protein
MVDREQLMALAAGLPSLWKEPSTDMGVKQRIVRLLICEIICNIDEKTNEIALMIHRKGGRHSERRIPRRRRGQHNRGNSPDVIEVVRRMAGRWSDEDIAATLNRLGLRTGVGNTWTASRVYSVRQRLDLNGSIPASDETAIFTLNQAAKYLGVGPWVVRKLIQDGTLRASQVVSLAPWEIEEAALMTEEVQRCLRDSRSRRNFPWGPVTDDKTPRLPGI